MLVKVRNYTAVRLRHTLKAVPVGVFTLIMEGQMIKIVKNGRFVKQKRKLLSLLLVISLCMQFPLTASALAPSLTQTQMAEALRNAGLFLGTGTGFALTEDLTRAQGITLALRAQGVEGEVLAQTEASVAVTLGRVKDGAEIPAWARKYVAYALNQNPPITRGVAVQADGRSIFAPNQKLSGTEFLVFMIRAMGYESTLDSAAGTALEIRMLADTQLGGISTQRVLTRGRAVEVMYTAMANGVVKSTNLPLAQTLLGKGAISTEAAIGLGFTPPVVTPTPTPTASPTPTPTASVSTPGGLQRISVTSVAAINTKQLLLTFNKPVSDESLIPANFEALENGILARAVTPSRSVTDPNSVVLTVSGNLAFTNFSTADITVRRAVRDEQGISLAEDARFRAVAIIHLKLPVLNSAQAIGRRTIQLSFDEPVWDGEDERIGTHHFAVNSGALANPVISAISNYSSNTVILTTLADIAAGQSTVTVNALGMQFGSVRNFIGLMLPTETESFIFTPDIRPADAAIERVNRAAGTVSLRFNKPVFGSQVRLFMLVRDVEQYGSAFINRSEAEAATAWNFTFSTPLPTGNIQFFLVSPTAAGQTLTDLFGVRVGDRVLTQNIEADTTAPTAMAAVNVQNTAIEVVFNEPLNAVEAERAANYELRTQGGALVSIASARLMTDRQTVRLQAALLDQETYSLRILPLRDLAGNAMSQSQTFTITVEDTSNPFVSGAISDTNARTITITFSEPMRPEEMADKSNYLVDVNGGTDAFATLRAADAVTALDSRRVLLQLSVPIASPSVRMAAIRDVSGRRLGSDTTFEYTGLNGNLLNIQAQAFSLVLAELVDYDMIRLVFSTQVTYFLSDDFLIRRSIDGAELQLPLRLGTAIATGHMEDGRFEVVVMLNRPINPDSTASDRGANVPLEVQVSATGTRSGTNTLLTNRNAANALDLADAFGGGIARDAISGAQRIWWNDINQDGRLDTVIIEYEEPARGESISILTYAVEGYLVDRVILDRDGIVTASSPADGASGSRFVVLTISRPGQTADAGARPIVDQVSPILDMQRNFMPSE